MQEQKKNHGNNKELKKTIARNCNDFPTISLICHASKIILEVLKKRIEANVGALNHLEMISLDSGEKEAREKISG